jgi:hypothetical protein
MPPKRVAKKRKAPKRAVRHVVVQGEGWFGDAIKSVGRFIKKNKLLSKGLSLIPHPAAQTASRVASTVGLGRGRQRFVQVPVMAL